MSCNTIDESMALSVTRHAPDPYAEHFQFLLCGIDSLDVGLYVTWGADWKSRLRVLNKRKQQARENNGLVGSLPSGRSFIFKPNGKGENYRFHLQFEAYNLFIGKAASAGSSPNVYLSIDAKTLWFRGIDTALSWIKEDLKAIGNGRINIVQVSRVDLCTDFFIFGGISYEFICSHKVTHNKKGNLYLDEDNVETYYLGNKNSPLRMRIYNKGIEIKENSGEKLWFLDLWEKENSKDVWRVEFQIRRVVLKQFGIDSIDDLKQKKGSSG